MGYSPVENEVFGLPMTRTMHDDLGRLDISNLTPPVRQVLVVHHEADARVNSLKSKLDGFGIKVEHIIMEKIAIWLKETPDAIVPHEVLHTVTNWLKKLAI